MEIWKDIQGFEGVYQVSNKGNVRSLERVVMRRNQKPMRIKERILKTCSNSHGYETAVFQNGPRTKPIAMHRLVAIAFLPLVDGKEYVNHIDGNKQNNHISNLEWVTRSENMKHAFAIGLLSHVGEKHNQSKLSESQVLEIRKMRGEKTAAEICKTHDVKRSAIYHIWNRRAWKHL